MTQLVAAYTGLIPLRLRAALYFLGLVAAPVASWAQSRDLIGVPDVVLIASLSSLASGVALAHLGARRPPPTNPPTDTSPT